MGWNEETIKLIRENFIAVAVPTWVSRAAGPEGEFLRSASIDKHWVTSSGYMNCVSASGKLLGRRPSQQVLEAFAKLPGAERNPGAVDVPDLQPSEHLIPAPPDGGLVLRVHARFLARGGDGSLRPAETRDFPLMRADPKVGLNWQLFLQPNTEYLWLTREEAQSLLPKDPQEGQRQVIDAAIPMRMARFHLNPKRATTSEGGIVPRKSVKTARLELVVEEVTRDKIKARLGGKVHWGSEYDAVQATSPNGPLALGYAAPLVGRLEFDRGAKQLTRFDLVAAGDVWGRWGDANGKSMVVERPLREPFGFAIELATGDSPSDRIPPGGNGRTVSEKTGYFSEAK